MLYEVITPHPAAQLMQCSQPEALGVLDDHAGGLGHVDADSYNFV